MSGSSHFGETSTTIGVVESVAPALIDVTILPEAPHGTSLGNRGFLRFPRINSYVVLPSERGSILAIVVWVGIDREVGRPRSDADAIGLPFPRRRLRALPLGVLRRTSSELDPADQRLTLDRGVLVFPTVGDPVRLPTPDEAAAIVPPLDNPEHGVTLGTAPLANDARVVVDPNRLLGRHLAILGNTGSGKSCTVSHVVRQLASSVAPATGAFRAIILDLNGEYGSAFADLDPAIKVRRLSAMPGDEEAQLRVPAWLWNYREWLSFTDASAKSQAPQLRRALQTLRGSEYEATSGALVALVDGRRIVREYASGAVATHQNSQRLSQLANVRDTCDLIATDIAASNGDPNPVRELHTKLTSVLSDTRRKKPANVKTNWEYDAFPLSIGECNDLMPLFEKTLESVGVPKATADGFIIDAPVRFDPMLILDLVPLLAADAGPETVAWVSPLVERLRVAFSDDRVAAICGRGETEESIGSWLSDHLGNQRQSLITVIDLSLVPSDVVHLVTAVFARVTLEALERHRRRDPTHQIPTVLVVEEAHSLIRGRRFGSSDDHAGAMAALCREAFERIAREGRKFGLSLVVSSQRPSELSETVLSQCNTFLVHRIVNDSDQALVRRLVPDALGALTDELPALPAQTALMMGWAIDVPTVVRIDDVPKRFQPHSSDPDFVSAWAGVDHGVADWESVADAWCRTVPEAGLDPGPTTSEETADPTAVEEFPF